MTDFNYEKANKFLNSFINYEKKKNVDYTEDNYDLKKFKTLLKTFDNPQKKIKTIHVAGSKGKGSTVEFIKNILITNGYRVGTFTSPHLVDVKERISLNGKNISKNEFAYYTEMIKNKINKNKMEKKYRTFFELITLLSFLYFNDKNVDFTIYEVGLGGRLDATNVILPELSIISLIDYEHTNILGSKIESIAEEKGGIIKEGVPVVVNKQRYKVAVEIFNKIAERESSSIFIYGRDFYIKEDTIYFNEKQVGKINIKMLGSHQKLNSLTALYGLKRILPDIDIQKSLNAINNTVLKGRIQKKKLLGRTVILDVAHTPESVKALFKTIQEEFQNRKIYSVVSYSSGKKIKKMLEIEKKYNTRIVLTENSSFRSANINEMVGYCNPVDTFKTFEEAFKFTLEKSSKKDIILIHGSFYLMTDVERVLNKYGQKL